MSQFIISFVDSVNPKPNKKMKFYFNITTHQWAVQIIPVIDFYFETCEPESHENFWKSKICGLYLSLSWLRRGLILGVHRRLR